MSKKKSEIGLLEKIAYGGGDLASNFILVITTTFVTFFYTDALGLNPGIIGTILMVSRLFDGVSDILMGFIMDKTKSKHGKARPWMLWLAAPIAIATVLMFTVPNLGETGKYIYVFITYNLVTTVLYTAINIPYGALNSLMTRDQNERMVINIFRMTMAQVGSLIINAFTLPIVNGLGGSANQKSWIIASIIYGFIAFLLFMLCFFKTKERVKVVTDQKPVDQMGFVEMFKLCLKNDQWLIIVGVWVVMAFGMSMGMGVATYYSKYVLLDENLSGLLMAASIAPVILTMPFLPFITQKIGKRNVAIIGGIVSIVGQFAMAINPANFSWLLGCSLVKGVGQAGAAGTIFAMVADTIEYGQWKTGVRTEGMLYSSTTFGAKVGGGVGGAIAMGILGAMGYNGLVATQNAAVMKALEYLYIYIPGIFLIVMVVLFVFYKLDKIYPQVMADLEAREAKVKQSK